MSYYWPAVEWGGPIWSVRLLCRALLEAGVSVEVATTTARGTDADGSTASGTRLVDGIPVHYFSSIPPVRYFGSPGLALFLARNLRRYDLVHVQGMFTFPSLVASRLAWRARMPYVLSPRGSLDPWALQQKSEKKWLYLNLLEAKTLLRSAALHFTAEDERRTVPAQFQGHPCRVVPNCVDVAVGLSAKRDASSTSKEILILGRIHKMKGFDILLPALASVARRVPAVKLVIAGPDEDGYGAVVREQARALGIAGRVQFVGVVDEAGRNELFQRVAVLVQPSYRENFGMAVAEAMAAGVPVVVSTNVNIAPDIKRAKAGLVVPQDPEALSAALTQVLESPSSGLEMGRLGAQMAAAHYSLPTVGRAMARFYSEVLQSADPPTRECPSRT